MVRPMLPPSPIKFNKQMIIFIFGVIPPKDAIRKETNMIMCMSFTCLEHGHSPNTDNRKLIPPT